MQQGLPQHPQPPRPKGPMLAQGSVGPPNNPQQASTTPSTSNCGPELEKDLDIGMADEDLFNMGDDFNIMEFNDTLDELQNDEAKTGPESGEKLPTSGPTTPGGSAPPPYTSASVVRGPPPPYPGGNKPVSVNGWAIEKDADFWQTNAAVRPNIGKLILKEICSPKRTVTFTQEGKRF